MMVLRLVVVGILCLCLGLGLGWWGRERPTKGMGPIVEVLTFEVPAAGQPEFIAQDEAIWGRALAQQPGFLGRQVWRSPNDPDEVTIIIYWASREQWKGISPSLINELDSQMQPYYTTLRRSEEYVNLTFLPSGEPQA